MVPPQRRTMAGRSPFGELLVTFRTARGLTQEGLAAVKSSERISSRSITNYERSVAEARMWVLPHRPALRSLANALRLDPEQMHALANAWDRSKALKDATANRQTLGTFITDGRERHLRKLEDAWKQATEGSPQLVLIGGENGMGKTSLARHFCDAVAARTPGAMISWGEATSRGSTIEPYIPIRHATDRILVPPPPTLMFPGFYESRPGLSVDGLRQAMAHLPKLTGVLVSERTIRDLPNHYASVGHAEVDSVLHARSGTESTGRWDEYCRLLMSLAQEWPLLIVLEDLHWTGELTALLLTHVHRQMQHMRGVPIMIIGTVFFGDLPDERNGQEHPLDVLRQTLNHSVNGTYLSLLDTISRENGSAFIRGSLGRRAMASKENEDALVAWMYAQTSGQPLLTSEMLKHLEESGALAQPRPTAPWTFNAAAVPPDLPMAVSNFMGQRLANVSRKDKAVLDAAAVMGMTILPETLAPVLDMEIEDLLELIDEVLVDQLHLLQPASDIPADGGTRIAYRFPHSLYRDFVYSSLPPFRRRAIHLKIAEQLSVDFANTDMEAMAEITNHFVLAEDWPQAAQAAYRTGQISSSRLDWDVAEFWFDRAEELALKAKNAEHLWLVRASRLGMMRAIGQHAEALALGERILSQVAFQNWGKTEALTRHLMGEIYFDLGRLDDTIAHQQQALEIHLREGSHDLAVAAEAMLSHATYRQGKYDIARDHARRALDMSRSLSDTWVQSEALLAFANCQVDLGFYDDAIAMYETTIELAQIIGSLQNEFICRLDIGLCQALLGRQSDAIDTLTRVLAEMDTHHIYRLAGAGALYLGLAYEIDGDWENAQAAFQRSINTRSIHERSPRLYDGVAGLVRIATALGDGNAVKAHLATIESYLEAHTWEGMEDPLQALMSIADAYQFLGNQGRYEQYVRRAHALLMDRAALIVDERAILSYLTNVEVNLLVQQAFATLNNAQRLLSDFRKEGVSGESAARG